MSKSLPYGAWPSAVTAADIAAGTTGLIELREFQDRLYWLESRPRENGRAALVSFGTDGVLRDLTPPPFNVRTRIHEYGGGAYLPCEAGVFVVNFDDQDIYLLRADEAPKRLTHTGPDERFADLCWDAGRQRLIAVCERHRETASGARAGEPENCLVSLTVPPEGPAAEPVILHQGHDFYAAPRVAPGGKRLSFVAWDHPNMPWDGTELRVAELSDAGAIGSETLIAGGAGESVLQPDWMEDGTLIYLSDANGFWNLFRFDASGVSCVLEDGADYADPPWVFGLSSWAPLDANHIVAVRRVDQRSELLLVDSRRGFASPLSSRWNDHQYLCASGRMPCFIGGRTDGPPEVVRYRFGSQEPEVLTRGGVPDLGDIRISEPEPVCFPTRDGQHAYAYFYPPAGPDLEGLPGELPPLVVMTHGGPTAAASGVLNLRIQYFTSRGFAVIDVDYRGSSGYGRAYREALDGRWGLVDVTDCEDAVNWLTGQGLADGRRVAIRGGSAGGFTTLCALTRSRIFGAGASHYGIGDLTALARDTHKFESRYLNRLIGDLDALEARSPIRHVDSLSCPVIFFQGTEDRVVPPNQAREMVAALNRKGLPVAYLEFDGEGHGFRQAGNVERALASEYAFYCRVFGIDTDEHLPDLEISNL